MRKVIREGPLPLPNDPNRTLLLAKPREYRLRVIKGESKKRCSKRLRRERLKEALREPEQPVKAEEDKLLYQLFIRGTLNSELHDGVSVLGFPRHSTPCTPSINMATNSCVTCRTRTWAESLRLPLPRCEQ